jgi:hypothetical protein
MKKIQHSLGRQICGKCLTETVEQAKEILALDPLDYVLRISLISLAYQNAAFLTIVFKFRVPRLFR